MAVRNLEISLAALFNSSVGELPQKRALSKAHQQNNEIDAIWITSKFRTGISIGEQIDIEIISPFAFQSGHSLGSIASDFLTPGQLPSLAEAKMHAAICEQTEACILRHPFYTKGWPTALPSLEEASLLSQVRQVVADMLELEIKYRDSASILDRYRELWQFVWCANMLQVRGDIPRLLQRTYFRRYRGAECRDICIVRK